MHAASVYVLLALTLGLCLVVRRGVLARAARVLLVVELAQGVIGFVQFYTGLPITVVALHLVGASLLVAAATAVLVLAVSPRPADDSGARPSRRERASV